jgi:hypothetical protein
MQIRQIFMPEIAIVSSTAVRVQNSLKRLLFIYLIFQMKDDILMMVYILAPKVMQSDTLEQASVIVKN